jgi:shikimate kinase
MNLYLIGYRGTGKSTVARLVAERLGWEAIDADIELERRAGRTIAAIFASDGEPAFRDLESAVLRDLSQRSGLVVGLGGGVVLRPENRALLRATGRTVWLTASPATIAARLDADATTAERRPALTAHADRLAEIEELLRFRTPLYEECAELTLATDEHPPEDLARAICDVVRADWRLTDHRPPTTGH